VTYSRVLQMRRKHGVLKRRELEKDPKRRAKGIVEKARTCWRASEDGPPKKTGEETGVEGEKLQAVRDGGPFVKGVPRQYA